MRDIECRRENKYRAGLMHLPEVLGGRVYFTAIIEAGSVFDHVRDARFKSSLTAGLAADTFLGPLFAGASVGNGGELRVYFLVGSIVR